MLKSFAKASSRRFRVWYLTQRQRRRRTPDTGPAPDRITADSTLHTADNAIVTADQN